MGSGSCRRRARRFGQRTERGAAGRGAGGDQRASPSERPARAARASRRSRQGTGFDASLRLRARARGGGPARSGRGGLAVATVEQLLQGKRICICAGSGGVGKTTTSAAIAAGMASRGMKVPVLGNEERQVDPALFADQGIETGGGELWAMMLDAKATFDEVIAKHAPDAETRERILENRIYKQLSNALAGSQEYMAMERLFELHQEDRYDLLVLDTPPSRNALDFLDAPRRLTQFIEGRSLQLFMRPPGSGMNLLGRGTSLM